MPERASLTSARLIVTGAAAGIGLAVAKAASAAGARVAMVDRDREALEHAAAAIGGPALAFPADVSDEGQVADAFAHVADSWGGLDAVAAIAGIELFRAGDDRIDRVELETWQRVLATNLTGMFLTCKHGARALLASGGGSITLTGSPCAITGRCSGETAYSASKAGVLGLVRVMATDLAPERIRVNAVIPGFVATQLNAPVLADPPLRATIEAGIPLGRAASPDEIAPMFVWLASDAAAYVTGAFMTVDGGMLAA
jgi:NAD(P)-dependent dehydrogenase (short-subunit alcohol dehydrogenase family)